MNKPRKFVESNLTERLKYVNNLSQEVYKALSLSPQKHNIWAVKDMQNLTLLTDDSILATQLRLEQQKITLHFKQQLNISIGKITIKMAMPPTKPRKKRKRKSKITTESTKTMLTIAQDIEDEELRAQIIRMAKQNNHR